MTQDDDHVIRARERVHTLTSREHEIFCLIGSALSNKEIARKLDIRESTVRAHVSHIFVKLDLRSRAQVALVRQIQLREQFLSDAHGLAPGTSDR